ncbi:hypothetical protein L218DRAFT_130597 [Marasmius fiardii PR-910]|nr:hypothetical protein L218DRAFT_130597 [Marasmius fiardii PR-910]
MPNGATRFHLKDGPRALEVYFVGARRTWLSQALSIFHAHGISLDEDLSHYKLVLTDILLDGTLPNSKIKRRRRQLCPPIYMFLLPLPSILQDGDASSSTALFHIWSFHETGVTPLSYDMCKYLGLPFKLLPTMYSFETSWPTKTYKTIHEYQNAKGFDPKTRDFAQSLGYSVFEILPAQQSRVQEVFHEAHDDELHSEISSIDNVQTEFEESNSVTISSHLLEASDSSKALDDYSIALDLLFVDNNGQGNPPVYPMPHVLQILRT